MKVLITGISGKAGHLVTHCLLAHGHTVIGIDRRSWANAPDEVRIFREDIRKRGAEEVFRSERLDVVVHMATVTHLTQRSEDRYRINMQGTRAVFDHSHTYNVKQVIFLGRHTFYGASAESPLYPKEDAPPSSVNTFPELSDLVAADLYAGSALWRYPELKTCVLRFCYTLGPACHGTLANFLKGKRVPSVLGFDPLFQFLHDEDMAAAVCIAIEKQVRGVFNVVGPMAIPLSVLIRECERTQIPVPESLFRFAMGRAGIPNLPRGAIAHIKYPIVVNGDAFAKATGFQYQHDHEKIIRDFIKVCPRPE
ncbi:MAG: NAD-dependent epimerase/dehydratase family protein [Kofleriaceae bacterium]|nr:NAD-dependent epimerase/dehydratase family protein [Kofleriaceae bacterium]